MNHKIQGQRVLIKLEEFSKQYSGIINPLYVEGVTDGGNPVSQLSEFTLAPVGTIVDIGAGALKTIDELGMNVKVGDRVMVQPHSITKGNYFYMNPLQQVIDITDEDERHIAIHPASILSIIEA